MASFGRRAARPAPPSRSDAPPRAETANPLVLGMVGLLALAGLCYSPGKQIVADRLTPLPADLTPGAQLVLPPQRPPRGCPARSWSVGEYLPKACIAEASVGAALAEQAGLEPPQHVGKATGRRKWSSFRQRIWVRAGDDALLVTRPADAAGRILYVAANRFGGQTSDAASQDDRSFRRPPADYIFRSASELLGVPLVGLLIIGGVAFAYRPRRSASSPGA